MSKTTKARPRGNQYFLLPNPDPSDKRPRNTWGILKDFGKKYAEYYERKDREAAKASSQR